MASISRSIRTTFVASLLVAGSLLGTAHAADTLRIGTLGDLSGSAAIWGQAVRGGVEIACDEVNAQGGLKVGDKKYKIEVVPYDDQFQVSKTLAAAMRLSTQDGIKFVMGTVYSPGALAAKPVFERNKVLTMTAGYSKKILDGNPKYTYRVGVTHWEFIPLVIKWMKESGAIKGDRVALISQNDEGGWDIQKGAQEYYVKSGFKVVGSESYEPTVRDFQPALTRLIAANPQVVDVGGSPPALAGLIVRQAREMGYKGQFVKLGGPGPREIVAAAGKEAAEGLLQFIPGNPDTDGFKRIAAVYKQRYGGEMDTLAISYYDATKILLAAISKAGTTTDTDSVIEALQSIKSMPSVAGGNMRLSGKETYGVENQLIIPFYVGEIVDGKVKIRAEF